ncbi:MAG: type II toxin-antitoxin system RelE/ParE family toxin [Acidimicrobiales bacterium]
MTWGGSLLRHASGPGTSCTSFQVGTDPSDWKPMASIGAGCREIRVRTARDAYRVIYVATIGEAVYVLHCFQKKTRQTAKADIDVAKQRYKQMTEIDRAREAP